MKISLTKKPMVNEVLHPLLLKGDCVISAVFLALVFLIFPGTVLAIEMPSGQIVIGANDILRGHFVEERQMIGFNNPIQSSGHFVVAPAQGLIWSIEKPFSTSTIITPDELVQDIGGIAIKLPAKNLHHLYNMIGGAIAGDWNSLETDFAITRTSSKNHWQMLLMPRPNNKSKLPYISITVSGGRFVEDIAMMKANSAYDRLHFADEVMTPAPLTADEKRSFNEAYQVTGGAKEQSR